MKTNQSKISALSIYNNILATGTKVVFCAVLIAAYKLSPAMQLVNLSNSGYTCSHQTINSTATVAWLIKNCKNATVKTDEVVINGDHPANRQKDGADDASAESTPIKVVLNKVTLYTDDGTLMLCYYKDNQLTKCKSKVTKVSN